MKLQPQCRPTCASPVVPPQPPPLRYQCYAFAETHAGTLTGVYGEFSGNAVSPATVPIIEFLNRRGEADRTQGFEGAALLTAGAWLSRQQNKRPGYSLKFLDRCAAPAPLQLSNWEPELAISELKFAPPCPHEIVRSVSLTGEALNVWLDTPAERSAAYLKWFAHVSFEMQKAFRRWLPYLLLRDEAIFNDVDLRTSLLFYAATRPYLAKVRGSFTWDVICPDSMATVFRSGSQNLYSVMERAQCYAATAGRQEMASQRPNWETRGALVRVRRDPKALKALLTLEGKLVEAVLALGIKGREINTKASPKHLHRFCSSWSRSLQSRLRRVYGGVALPELVDLALLEGTAALAACLGIAPERREEIELEPINAGGMDSRPADSPLPRAA